MIGTRTSFCLGRLTRCQSRAATARSSLHAGAGAQSTYTKGFRRRTRSRRPCGPTKRVLRMASHTMPLCASPSLGLRQEPSSSSSTQTSSATTPQPGPLRPPRRPSSGRQAPLPLQCAHRTPASTQRPSEQIIGGLSTRLRTASGARPGMLIRRRCGAPWQLPSVRGTSSHAAG
jgi:hypothetical protein